MSATASSRKASLRLVQPKSEKMTPDRLVTLIESGQPHSELDVFVTPELAKTLLRYNKPGITNRKLNQTSIANATRALVEGTWTNTGEPIIISDAQLLNDGQNRLEAIVSTGIPAVSDIRFGVSRGAFAATNSGSKRSAADALTIKGGAYGNNVAAVARLLIAYERGLQAVPTGACPTPILCGRSSVGPTSQRL